MDPNEALRMLQDTMFGESNHRGERDWCRDIAEWVAKGGFEPDWERYPHGAARFHRYQKTGR